MIVYKLKCDINHIFECWFRNSEAFEDQQRHKLLSCPFCTSTSITKAPMSPRLSFQKETTSSATEESTTLPFEGDIPSSFLPEVYASKNEITDAIHLTNTIKKSSLLPDSEISIPSNEEIPHPSALVRKALLDLKDFVKKNCDDVGNQFAEEARRIHYGETKKRNIYGQTSLDEIIELHQEGVEVSALPPFPREDA
ncbi:MAG: DUF1178 family protein [Proteobacteria bacterium]|nr:DUF1178 family protein [Pseudomonadota bacterium]